MSHDDDPELSALVRAKAARYQAPAELRRLISASLAQAAAPGEARTSRWMWRFARPGLGFAAAFACGVLASVLTMQFLVARPADERVANEVVSAHVRSLMAGHLQDVASTDQHVVKPWFAGKLDFSPPVEDYAARGYPLGGARLDYLDGRPVAALVYRRRMHAINVFVWPAVDAAPRAAKLATLRGFNVLAWRAAGMQFWAVSDVGAEELKEFSALLHGGG